MTTTIKDRLEYLRGELQAERISTSELAELQGLAGNIEPGDVELLEAAGVPEFPPVKIPVKYIDTRKYVITISQDQWADSPEEWGNYKLHDWTHGGKADIDDFFTDERKLKPAIQTKIRAGKMWLLDKYEHSGVSWSLSGEGMNCRWDTSRWAGILEFSDDYIKGISKDERERYARGDIEEYNQWLNGDVYDVSIATTGGIYIDSCGGLYGREGIDNFINDTIPDALSENITEVIG